MFSLFKWQKINFQTSQFNHFAFCRKSMTSSGHDIVKVFFFTRPTNPIWWVWVQRIPSFFLYYCKQKFYNHFCKAWGFMLQNQGNMPWCLPGPLLNYLYKCPVVTKTHENQSCCIKIFINQLHVMNLVWHVSWLL